MYEKKENKTVVNFDHEQATYDLEEPENIITFEFESFDIPVEAIIMIVEEIRKLTNSSIVRFTLGISAPSACDYFRIYKLIEKELDDNYIFTVNLDNSVYASIQAEIYPFI